MKEKILANRYRLTEQIGMGGMAIVYRAVDLRTGHNVAVKVLRPEYNEDTEFISRFQREAEAASKMTHHNIVNLLDVGMDGDNRYLVMEYVQGKTLKSVIQERGKLSPALAGQIAIRILSALEHAHRNGIIHRSGDRYSSYLRRDTPENACPYPRRELCLRGKRSNVIPHNNTYAFFGGVLTAAKGCFALVRRQRRRSEHDRAGAYADDRRDRGRGRS